MLCKKNHPADDSHFCNVFLYFRGSVKQISTVPGLYMKSFKIVSIYTVLTTQTYVLAELKKQI